MLSFVPAGPNWAAKAARKPCLGGPGGALGTLAFLEPSWGPPGASQAAPGRLPRADLNDLDVVCGAT